MLSSDKLKHELFFIFSMFLLSLGSVPVRAQEIPIKGVAEDSVQLDRRNFPSPKGAMIRSIIFPGWGQWYNGKKFKAVLVFFTEAGIIGTSIYWNNRAKKAVDKLNHDLYIDYRNQAYWFLGGAILLSMADAYVDAHLAGFDVSPELGFIDNEYKFAVNLKYHF